jgi:hypothetical protein
MAGVVAGSSYVTIASLFSRDTWTRVTPLTASSADRTASMHPSHVMPSTVRVTVFAPASGDVAGALRQDAATVATRTSQLRRVIILIEAF